MALDIPILNYEQKIRLINNKNKIINYASSLPDIPENIYWKDFIDFKSFLEGYRYILNNYDKIHPKKYILKNLSPKVTAKKLVELFKKIK